jgi:hypothetical protein
VPDGYALVEFFGTHDFGWVKQDTMIPMLLNGSFGGQGGKIGIYSHDLTFLFFNYSYLVILFQILILLLCVMCCICM